MIYLFREKTLRYFVSIV